MSFGVVLGVAFRFGLGSGGEEEERRRQEFGLSNRRGLEGRERGLVAEKMERNGREFVTKWRPRKVRRRVEN